MVQTILATFPEPIRIRAEFIANRHFRYFSLDEVLRPQKLFVVDHVVSPFHDATALQANGDLYPNGRTIVRPCLVRSYNFFFVLFFSILCVSF
jgi:hypothetical protein